MRYLLVLLIMLGFAGCTPEARRQRADIWLEKMAGRAEYFDQREWKTCLYGEGSLEPYGLGKALIATGGAEPLDCGKLFSLPGAASFDE